MADAAVLNLCDGGAFPEGRNLCVGWRETQDALFDAYKSADQLSRVSAG